MTDTQIVEALSQDPQEITLSSGKHQVKPLTVRRLAKLAAMLKDVQGDSARFKNPESPDFHRGVTDMLVAAGDKMPAALGLLTGDPEFEKQEDITLLDLSVIVVAAANVNRPSFLLNAFRQAMEVFNGKAEQK